MRCIFIYLIVICLFFPCYVKGEDIEPLTLNQCIIRGLEYNPEVKAYSLAIEEADEGIGEAFGAFLPTLGLNYNATKLKNRDEKNADAESGQGDVAAESEGMVEGETALIDDGSVAVDTSGSASYDGRVASDQTDDTANTGVATDTPSVDATDSTTASDASLEKDYLSQRNNTYSLRVTQPLFTGFSGLAGLTKAQKSKEYRQSELLLMQNQLAYQIRMSFFDWISADQRLMHWSQSIERLEKQNEIVAAWVKQKLATKLRVLEIGVELSNARQQMIKARSDKATAMAKLRQWLAIEQDHRVDIAGTLDNPDLEPCTNREECQELALTHRPELVLARLNIEIAEQDVKAIIARNLPQAQAEMAWTKYHRNYEEETMTDDSRDYFTVMFSVNFTPFQGGRNLFAWRKQTVAIRRLHELMLRQRNAIVTDVETRYQQVIENRSRIVNANDSLTEAKAAYAMAAKSSELGVVSLNELLDAELRLTRSEINLTEAKYTHVLAQTQLLFAVGRR